MKIFRQIYIILKGVFLPSSSVKDKKEENEQKINNTKKKNQTKNKLFMLGKNWEK